jgi:outer membrane protein assembly factor BamD
MGFPACMRRAERPEPKEQSHLPLPVSRPAASRLAMGLCLTAALGLSGCGILGKKAPKQDLSYQERPVELLYATGAQKLDRRQWNDAAQYFGEVERQHPYSEWARRSILMTAYAKYQSNQYQDAIDTVDRFIQLYPGNSSTPYAYYLRAQCWFEQIDDVGRDQGFTEQALAALNEVVKRYPDTPYAVDARLKIDMVNDQLAGKEMAVGRWYLRQNQPISAIGRFKTVIDRYQTTSHTPEALYRLVEANLTLGLVDEAKKNGAVLGHNFPGDLWYSEAYSLLTARGLRPLVQPTGKRRVSLPLPSVKLPHMPRFGKAPPPPKT